jgi:nucleotide-binding universal stress UspA family protein
LPFLQRAEEVIVVAVSESGRSASAADVASYLGAHKIRSRTLLRESRQVSAADDILDAVRTEQADLLVAGAYGHARISEWVFGGVSRDLLDHTPVCTILSH